MPEYNIGFSEKLVEAAKVVADNSLDSIEGQRTVLYLSLLSCEIALKALLESAGISIQEITRYSHNLRTLIDAICRCEVKEEIVAGQPTWVPASRVCAITVAIETGTSTVGTVLSMEKTGTSRYPNEIRYGHSVVHVPAKAMLQAAEKLLEWVNKHLSAVRQKPSGEQSQNRKTSERTHRRRDTLAAAAAFCKAYGGGVHVGEEIKFSPDERNEHGQDYWIGYVLADARGNKCGAISAGYVGGIGNIRLYAEIIIDGEVIESEAQFLKKMSSHERENNEQPKELKALFIKIAERATRKANALQGV
jgi:HEPN domain-containing protein